MESRARTLNRADFETDEQFQAYKSQREAAPKAAFQFGVKVRSQPPVHWPRLWSSRSGVGVKNCFRDAKSLENQTVDQCCMLGQPAAHAEHQVHFLRSVVRVQMADGRRSHKDMEKRNNNKIDNELKQLRNMKGEKAGRNVDFTQFDGAFGSSQKDGAAPTPARKRPKLQGI